MNHKANLAKYLGPWRGKRPTKVKKGIKEAYKTFRALKFAPKIITSAYKNLNLALDPSNPS